MEQPFGNRGKWFSIAAFIVQSKTLVPDDAPSGHNIVFLFLEIRMQVMIKAYFQGKR